MLFTYLRVTAVNLSDSVYDTNDISTIRGGGFMLLEAVNKMAEAPELTTFLEKISTGASEGIFILKGDAGVDAGTAKKEVWNYLSEQTRGHATFSVDVLTGESSEFEEVQEQLIAENRWRQLQQLTVSLGDGWKGAETACFHNGVRPGFFEERPTPGERRKVSGTVQFRRKKGRELRSKIYGEILGIDPSELPSFTDSLEDLSTRPDGSVSKNLDGKIAFIYVDGNKFGKIRQKHCRDADSLTAFDKAVQEDFRASLLKHIITSISDKPAWSFTKDGKKHLRFETLLWGGDEIEWIVPAWKGWEILRMFYEFDPPPAFGNISAGGQAIPLTHAAGIVFCKHSAPILQIRKLARNLADLAKGRLVDVPKSREEGDVFHYLALDSFDMIEGDVEHFLKQLYQPFGFQGLLMGGSKMKSFSNHMARLRSDFPRGKLHKIIEALKNDQDTAPILKSALSFCPEERREKLEDAIHELIAADPTQWFAIADLWDYA